MAPKVTSHSQIHVGVVKKAQQQRPLLHFLKIFLTYSLLIFEPDRGTTTTLQAYLANKHELMYRDGRTAAHLLAERLLAIYRSGCWIDGQTESESFDITDDEDEDVGGVVDLTENSFNDFAETGCDVDPAPNSPSLQQNFGVLKLCQKDVQTDVALENIELGVDGSDSDGDSFTGTIPNCFDRHASPPVQSPEHPSSTPRMAPLGLSALQASASEHKLIHVLFVLSSKCLYSAAEGRVAGRTRKGHAGGSGVWTALT